jgi:hypothetical protein
MLLRALFTLHPESSSMILHRGDPEKSAFKAVIPAKAGIQMMLFPQVITLEAFFSMNLFFR